VVWHKRKNACWGDLVRRVCICDRCRALCPVHVVLPWLAEMEIGEAPFNSLSAAAATRRLRKHLSAIGVTNAADYTLHSFRRGAAQDLVQMGADIETLLAAGGWNSRACCEYVKPSDLNPEAVLNYIIDDSDSDGA
jgi:hypothetical protein